MLSYIYTQQHDKHPAIHQNGIIIIKLFILMECLHILDYMGHYKNSYLKQNPKSTSNAKQPITYLPLKTLTTLTKSDLSNPSPKEATMDLDFN